MAKSKASIEIIVRAKLLRPIQTPLGNFDSFTIDPSICNKSTLQVDHMFKSTTGLDIYLNELAIHHWFPHSSIDHLLIDYLKED